MIILIRRQGSTPQWGVPPGGQYAVGCVHGPRHHKKIYKKTIKDKEGKDSQNYNQSGEVTQAEVKPVKKKFKLGKLTSY